MPSHDDEPFPRPLRLFVAKGANRIRHWSATSISEAFEKNASPEIGDVCVLVQYEADDYSLEDPDEGDDGTDDSDGRVIAIAIVRGVAGVASGTVRATLSPIYPMVRPVLISELRTTEIELGEVPAPFYSERLSPRLATALIRRLKGLDPDLEAWLVGQLTAPREFSVAVNQSRAEARDAVQLAAQFADVELPPDAFVSPPAMTENETLLQTLINAGYEQDLEEELLPLDLQRFDGKLTGKQESASLAVFEDARGRARLVVMSVNKKPIELELGVDLLYWDQVHDAFTFIQYKRLEKTSKPTGESEWAYLRESEITKQLALMPAGRVSSSSAADWRAFGTPFWFKFVRGDAGTRLDEKTLKGMHVPADWLRLAVADGSLRSGARGGFRVTYDNTKYIGRSAFTQLISRGFVGTTRARSKSFKKLLGSKKRELIVAIRTEWQNDDVAPLADPVVTSSPELPF
ncbi:hypothetical protein [Leifsonia sp. P73]|uniref:hypothetical protein n=1 Tax=Leifsonia sp. P73 TaxID=3423959 RepID=UPI003DA20A7E